MISWHVKISFLKNDHFVPLTTLKFIGVWWKHLRIFFGHLRQSTVIFGNHWKMFGNAWKMFGNICLAFRPILENLQKSSESGWKSSENRRILWNKKQLHGCVETQNLSSRVEKYFTCSLRSLVNIFQHSKINFVSPRGHVISSVYYTQPSHCALRVCLIGCVVHCIFHGMV